jgi:hypothetical protein
VYSLCLTLDHIRNGHLVAPQGRASREGKGDSCACSREWTLRRQHLGNMDKKGSPDAADGGCMDDHSMVSLGHPSIV